MDTLKGTGGPATAAELKSAHKLNLQGPLCASITTGRNSDDDKT
jgi:hypothetical protein